MSYPIQAVVVGVMHPGGDDPALRAAVDIARRSDATLHAVHAFELPALFTMSPGLQMTAPTGITEYVELMQRDLEARMRTLYPEDVLVCHAIPGAAHHAIVETAATVRADLVVVGAAHHGPIARALLGTTAERVLATSPAPVFVVRGAPVTAERVLMTTDLTNTNGSALSRGLELVEAISASPTTELRALLVLVDPEPPPPVGGDAMLRAAGNALMGFLADHFQRARSIVPTTRRGSPAAEITAEADHWGADLVLLGTHGRQQHSHWLLGSVAQAAVRDLRCNTLVVPPEPLAAASHETPALRGAA